MLHQPSVKTPLTTTPMYQHTPKQYQNNKNTTLPNPTIPIPQVPNTTMNNLPAPNHKPNPTIPNPIVNTTQHNSGVTTNPSHRYWKIARDDINFEPHRFQSYVKDIILVDNTLHSIHLFYNRIRHTLHTSFKKHNNIFPPFDSLTSTTSFYDILVPGNDQYLGYTTIKSIYQWFSDSILNMLLDVDVINPKCNATAHQIITTNSNINNGWQLLFHLLTKLCPFLGGKLMDVVSEITLLKINNMDTIHTFYKRIQEIETKLIYSRETVDKTRLLRFYLKAMATSTIHFPLLQHFISDLNIHISKFGSNVAHPTHICSTVYDYLLTVDAPEHFSVSHNNKYKNHKHHSYKNNRKDYTSGYSTSTISAMEHLPDIMENQHIIETYEHLEHTNDDDNSNIENIDETTIKAFKPIISTFLRTSNIICDACGGRGHQAQKCYKRGRNFLPRDVQRRIAAYNAKYGDAPTNDTSQTPNKAYHALQPSDHRPPSTSVNNNTNKTRSHQHL